MNSRERVLRTLEFDRPDRLPRDLWTLPWADLNYPEELAALRRDFPSDFGGPPGILSKIPETSGDPHKKGEYRDEWGCVFINIQDGAIGEVKQPLIQDWDRDTEKVHFPREWLTFDRSAVRDYCHSTDLFVRGGCCPRPFEQMQFLRGTENLYADIATKDPGFLGFLGRIHEFYLDLFEEWAKTEIDGMTIMDDWGAQSTLLISPKSWREIFKPLYQDYARIAHEHGKKIFMHSDGHILAIYPDLIEIGIDALNSQVFCMGLENLSQYKGKITFWGEIDRQHLLPHATPEEIRQAVVRFQDNLYSNGGVIAQLEFGLLTKPENVRAAFETWDQFKT